VEDGKGSDDAGVIYLEHFGELHVKLIFSTLVRVNSYVLCFFLQFNIAIFRHKSLYYKDMCGCVDKLHVVCTLLISLFELKL